MDPSNPEPVASPPATDETAKDAPATDVPESGSTVDMSQVAGERAAPVQADPERKKKKKAKVEAMTEVASAPLSKADQALADLGTKRGIETLFRTNYRVNMDLTSLADAKANIMISINGLIVSILIASIAPGIEKNPWLLIPTSLFLVGCLGSLIFAVLAARPRVSSHVVTKESAMENRTNVLFFGNFHHMPQEDYVYVMKEVVQDPTQIYEMMIKDIYGVGSVLQKKYVMIRRSYTIFLGALVVGVVGFIGVFAYAATQETPRVPLPVQTDTGVPVPGILPLGQ